MAGRSFATTTTPTANDVKNKLAGLASGLLSNPENKLPTLQRLVDAAKTTAQKTTQKTTTKATTTLPTYLPGPTRDALTKITQSLLNKQTSAATTPVSATKVTTPKTTTAKTTVKASAAAPAVVAPAISWAYNGEDGGGGSSSSSSGYDAAKQAYKEAMDAAYNQTKAQYMAQAEQLKGQYDTTRGQAYTTSRLNAIGNNEALASMGLAGNMYEGPTSGYSETSRIAENTAMRGSINEANLAERQARDSIADAIIQAGYTRDQSVAQYTADLLVQQAQDQLQRDLAAQQLDLQYAQLAAQLAKTATKTSSGGGGPSSKKVTIPVPENIGKSTANQLVTGKNISTYVAPGTTRKDILTQRKG